MAAACDILLWAAQREQNARDSYPHKTALVLESVSERLPAIDEHSLAALSKHCKRERSGDLPGQNRVILLEATPKSRSTIPVVRLHWNLDEEPFDVSVRVGLFWYDEDSDLLLAASGFRFESPEGTGGGTHDYFHVQPIMALSKDEQPLPGLRGQIPTDFPAIPLPATGPGSLMTSVLVGLFGGGVLPALRSELPVSEPYTSTLRMG